MSVQAMSWVIEHSPEKGGSLVCLLMIANYANADGTGAFPSYARLARDCRMSERQVMRLVQGLEARGAIEVEHVTGRGHTNRIRVLMTDEQARKGDITMSPNEDEKGDTVTSPFVEEKGDKLSPFSAERVTNPARKGDKSSTKGDIAMSPEPSVLTVNVNQSPDACADALARASPFQLVEAMCQELGVTSQLKAKTFVNQQCGIAKDLAADGITPDDIRGFVRYLLSQKTIWRRSLIDMQPIKRGIHTWITGGRPEREEPIQPTRLNGTAQEPTPHYAKTRFTVAERQGA